MNLPESFRQYGELLANNASFSHEWTSRPDGCVLSIPSQSKDGFDVRVDVGIDEATVFWGNGHSHYEVTDNIQTLVEEIFGLLRDLLSTDMRVRHYYAAGTLYWAKLEAFDGTKWSVERSTGLIFWNYFGKRSVTTHSNAVLPGRLSRDPITLP
ncbi:MAG: hypothetical protein Q7T81_02685 [Pseudolabrys sp.]|nr:hypothetical protein [Pseudolabrys sp.]